MTLELTHRIGGARLASGTPGVRLNPSDTGETVARFPQGGASEVDAAVSAARAAQTSWSRTPIEQRSDILDRAGAELIARSRPIGELLAREEGKTLAEGVGETLRAGRIFRYFAAEALRPHGVSLDSTRPGVEVQTYREPVGVFGLITPWNFPIAIPAWKSAPALAFGNAVVLKPSDLTPALASVLGDILEESGLPAGVFNLVLGGADAGEALARHAGVDGISFTGSQAVGRSVAQAAAGRQARVQLEMGGKNPLVVLNDADLDRAVEVALDGAFLSTGQRCTASSRLILEDEIHDAFLERLAERLGHLKVGHALDPQTRIGPAVSQAQQARTGEYLDIALKEGARLVGQGAAPKAGPPGWYVAPVLLAETDVHMRINREEVFGPLAAAMRVADYETALEAANSGEFGLSAGIVTSSLKHARHFQRNVRAGMTMVNLATAGVDYHVPFGGVAASSHGPREQGFQALEFYTQTRTAYSLAWV